MEFKDGVAAFSVLVAAASLFTAVVARDRADDATADRFEADKTLELLSAVYEDLVAARNDSERLQWSCHFVATLAKAESSFRTQPPHFVSEFVGQVIHANLFEPPCEMQLESFVPGVDTLQTIERPAAERTLGRYHAVIASYRPSPNACEQAGKVVAEFADRLSEVRFDGHPVSIVHTRISNNYAVTVDAADDEALARSLTRAIAEQALDDGTGRDSFVQRNLDWFIDPDCNMKELIGRMD